MRQIIIGHSDSSKLGTYKVIIGENTFNAMQSKQEQRRALKKPKRFRSAFTTEQTNYLEEQFKKFQYIDREQRQQVAKVLNIGERPIKIWFQNRRMKKKKENHKEFDDETCDNVQNNDKNNLNNVSPLPSANDNHLYSLPILSFTADTAAYANNDSVKAKININDSKVKQITKPESPNSTTPNIEDKKLPLRANFYKELNGQEHVSPHYHQQPVVDTTVPFTADKKNKKPPSREYLSNTSAEFSISLCKKYKQQCTSTDAAVSGNITNEDQKMKTEAKDPPKVEMKPRTVTKDVPSNKESKVSYPPQKLPTQMNLNNAVYYPAMPNVYAPPMSSLPPSYMGPDGVLWKPVNVMPMMPTNSPLMNNIEHWPPHKHMKNCICNCHGSSQHVPVTMPPTVQNPYAQYVITVPFPHTSPSF